MVSVTVDKKGLVTGLKLAAFLFLMVFVAQNASGIYNIIKHETQVAALTDFETETTSPTVSQTEEADKMFVREGKYIELNMDKNELLLNEDEHTLHSFSVMTPVVTSSAQAIPQGTYTIDEKKPSELSTITMVRFPQFIKFGDTYALHGTPQGADGTELDTPYTGSLVEMKSGDAEVVYDFAEAGMSVFVQSSYEIHSEAQHKDVQTDDLPATSALAYALKDVSTGETYLVKNGDDRYPIASITKLMTAAVATDAIGHGTEIFAPDREYYTLSELYYPLLLRSDNRVANNIAAHSGTNFFMSNMNAYARSVGMNNSSFSDASGLSPKNISTANDLIRFAEHIYKEKPFIFDISKEESMTVTSRTGKEWTVVNQNKLAADPHFRGGKLGYTDEAAQTSLAVFNVPLGDEVHPIAVVVLHSWDWKQDTRTLLRWLVENTKE